MLHQEDNLIKCPYNDAHLIRPKRMQTHLVKCRKSNISQDYVHCPLDATHHLPRQELEYHLQTCSKRAVVESSLYKRTLEKASAPILTPEAVNSLLPDTAESWDSESVPTYNPMEHTANRSVIRILKGAPPAERKAFQMQERRRLLDLQDKEEKEGPVKVLSTRQTITTDNSNEGVRLPLKPSKAVLCAQKQAQQGHQK